jgi:hypothetical protein
MDYWKRQSLHNLCSQIKRQERDTFRDALAEIIQHNEFNQALDQYIKIAIYKFGGYLAVHLMDSLSATRLNGLLAPCVDKGMRVLLYTHKGHAEMFPGIYAQKSAILFVPTNRVVANDVTVIEENEVGLNESIRWLKERCDENPERSNRPAEWLFTGFVTSEITSRECLWSSETNDT